MALGPEGRQVHEADHHEQGGLAHSRVGEDEELGTSVAERLKIAAQKIVDRLEGRRPHLSDGLPVLMPVGRIIFLASGLDVETGKLMRVTEHIADTGELVTAFVTDARQLFDQRSEPGDLDEGG